MAAQNKKKDFDNLATGRVYERMEQATSTKRAHRTPTQTEIDNRRATMKTQGIKDAGMKRINMAFSDPNYDFIRVLARASGKTMTGVVNLVISAYRTEHPELMQHAMAVQTELEETFGVKFDTVED